MKLHLKFTLMIVVFICTVGCVFAPGKIFYAPGESTQVGDIAAVLTHNAYISTVINPIQAILRRLDMRQRIVLQLFIYSIVITSDDVAKILRIHLRTAQDLCRQWVKEGFLIIHDPSKKNRSYELSPELEAQLFGQFPSTTHTSLGQELADSDKFNPGC